MLYSPMVSHMADHEALETYKPVYVTDWADGVPNCVSPPANKALMGHEPTQATGACMTVGDDEIPTIAAKIITKNLFTKIIFGGN